MRKAALLLAPSLLLLLSSTSPAQVPKTFEQLKRKSIFAKDRVARSSYTRTYASATPQASASPILIGIIDDESGYIAVLETPGAGILTPVHLGDTLPGNAGTVTAMTLDYIEFLASAAPPPLPATKPSTEPTTAPATIPATEPTTEPAANLTIESDMIPATRPTTQPTTAPVIEPSAGPTTRRIAIGHNLEGTQIVAPVASSSASPSTAPIEGDDIVSRMRRRRQQEASK